MEPTTDDTMTFDDFCEEYGTSPAPVRPHSSEGDHDEWLDADNEERTARAAGQGYGY